MNKQLEFPTMTIVVRSVFEGESKFILKFIWMNVCMSYKC